MAEVLPFRGLRYNVDVIGDLGMALCPPYDVISTEEQKALYSRTPFNTIRLELPLVPAAEDAKQERTVQAQKQLLKWLKERVIVPEDKPALYLTHHTFTYQGKRYIRRELTARIKLEDFSKGVVRPHEQTAEKPKEERLALLEACQANLSPIMGLYDDNGTISRLLKRVDNRPSHLKFKAPEGDEYSLWVITDEGQLDAIHSAFSPLPLYIADGHHRYEASLRYRDLRHISSKKNRPGAPYDFVMMTMIDMKDPGLLALPYHRMAKGLSLSDLSNLRKRLDLFFGVRSFSLNEAQGHRFWITSTPSKEEAVIGIWGLEKDSFLQARIKSKEVLAKLTAREESDALRSLSPTIFREGILKPALGMEEEEAEKADKLVFVKDFNEAIERVSSGECQVAFILAPVPLTALKRVSDEGKRLPPKSTYFYPKLPTGLTFYSLRPSLI